MEKLQWMSENGSEIPSWSSYFWTISGSNIQIAPLLAARTNAVSLNTWFFTSVSQYRISRVLGNLPAFSIIYNGDILYNLNMAII